MTAEIIDLWLHKKGVRRTDPATLLGNPRACAYEPRLPGALVDRNCPCKGCRELYAGMQRTTQEIFRDLLQLRMKGPEDEAARRTLFAELEATGDFTVIF